MMEFVGEHVYTHIMGSVYGQALGDAWAMPAYLSLDQSWTYYEGWIKTLFPAPEDHPIYAGFQAGRITDATEQAIALAETIIVAGQITLPGATQAILKWYDRIGGDQVSYIDAASRQAVANLKAGWDPHLSGQYGDTSGGAMRISPVALIHPGNPEAAIEDAIVACTPTHFTDTAISGACAVVGAIAEALNPETTLEAIVASAIHGAEIGRQQGVPWWGGSIARKIDYAIQLATEGNLTERDRLRNISDLIGSTPAPADAVPCAFGMLAMGEGNPLQVAIYAATLSGEANTVGAMAGAIAGAWCGIQCIPVEYMEVLRQANPHYDFDDIAAGLYHIAENNYQTTQIAAPAVNEELLNTLLEQQGNSS